MRASVVYSEQTRGVFSIRIRDWETYTWGEKNGDFYDIEGNMIFIWKPRFWFMWKLQEL